MGRPRFHLIRTTLTAIIVAGAMIPTIAASVSATPWQKSWGDYDGHDQWHDASWWLQNRHNWVTVHHPEWTEKYADTFGRIGDYDRRHMWYYGDGGFDRHSTAPIAHEPTKESPRLQKRQQNPAHPSETLRETLKWISKSSWIGRDSDRDFCSSCFGGGPGYSNRQYGYNGGCYNSNPYDSGYGNHYPYNSGYNGEHSYSQNYENPNSYGASNQDGVRADASRDSHQDRDQARTEKQPSHAGRDDYFRKDSRSEQRSEGN